MIRHITQFVFFSSPEGAIENSPGHLPAEALAKAGEPRVTAVRAQRAPLCRRPLQRSRIWTAAAFLLSCTTCAFAQSQQPRVISTVPGDNDLTLKAMRDEMDRTKERLIIKDRERPFYIEYRLIDVEVKSITASFGALVNSATSKNRLMSVDVRVGDYHLDSSNFLTEEGFRGFIGNTGTVGIDRDYDSLRQDLWLATDQAYKSALDSISRKRGYIKSLATPTNTDDFSKVQPVVMIEPRKDADWSSRDWDAEAKTVSAVLRKFPALYSSRVNYYLVFTTEYLMTSEGTLTRVSRTVSGIEAGLDTQAEDGMRLHHFYSAYAPLPAQLPKPDAVKSELERVGAELVALRGSATATDYAGPVLFESSAAPSLLAQLLPPSVSGARSPLAMVSLDQFLESRGGRSEWASRMGSRVLPAGITVTDDPTAKEFKGMPLIGTYSIDEEGVPAQKVTLVENGTLKTLLMSRRPGQEFYESNGHGRSALLDDQRPAMSNTFFQAVDGQSPADIRKKFMETCKASGKQWCLIVRKMDNPALAFGRQDDFADVFAGLAAGAATGDRQPLLVYRVNVNDGREELIRGSRLTGLNLRSLRNVAAIGNDYQAYNYFQNSALGFAGTAFNAFASAQGGLPSSIVAPSLLFEELEVRGARGEPRRLPIVPPPPME